ncbi:hypothetical protein K501DRAFT_273519 [Backusella circina FSU 941]|nr:hypothetical protein K501DRAFT_273519 [Backusella circina FSU 941]
MILSSKDEVGWPFNLSFLYGTKCGAIITKHETILYVDQIDLPEVDHLTFVKIRSFSEFFHDIAGLSTQLRDKGKVIISDKTCARVEMVIGKIRTMNHILQEEYSFISSRKAVPTKVESNSIRTCYLKDGAAIITFLTWLESTLNNDGKGINISDAKFQLDRYRRLQENYKMSATLLCIKHPSDSLQNSNDTSRFINSSNTIYINSSGHYSNGTTKFIGTFHFNTPSAFEKRCYTRVLQAHIAIDTCTFPRGTTGDMIDSLGRQALWKEGLDSNNSFIKNHHDENMDRIPLTACMLLSNEPSYSKEFCVKSTVIVKQIDTPLCKNSYSLGFEHVSFIPLCRNLIEMELLSSEERDWINAYHKGCFDHLGQRVDEKTLAWLAKETCPI